LVHHGRKEGRGKIWCGAVDKGLGGHQISPKLNLIGYKGLSGGGESTVRGYKKKVAFYRNGGLDQEGRKNKGGKLRLGAGGGRVWYKIFK